MNAGAGKRGDGFVEWPRCGAGAGAVRRAGGGGGLMWGWLVRMTKGMGRGWPWPSPEATRCLSLHPPGARACGCGVHCCNVCSNSAIARARAAPSRFSLLGEDGGGSAAWGGALPPGGSKQSNQWRGERERACRVRVFVWHGALSGSRQKKAERPMPIGVGREKSLAICKPKFCCHILCVSDELPVRFRGVSRHAELVLFFSAEIPESFRAETGEWSV
jgi:hypothetical protein